MTASDLPAAPGEPRRIQRKRTKGSRTPPGTIYAGRGSKLGNPFVIGQPSGVFDDGGPVLIPALTREQCVSLHATLANGILTPEMYPDGHRWLDAFSKRYGHPVEFARSELRGKSMSCWCAILRCSEYVPCHVDVLLSIANDKPLEEVIRENIRWAEGEVVR